jgi:hypothetical protein
MRKNPTILLIKTPNFKNIYSHFKRQLPVSEKLKVSLKAVDNAQPFNFIGNRVTEFLLDF